MEFPYDDYLLGIGYFTTILTSPKRGIFFYFGGGPSVGYKYINDGETYFPFDAPEEVESSFIYEDMLLLRWTSTSPVVFP